MSSISHLYDPDCGVCNPSEGVRVLAAHEMKPDAPAPIPNPHHESGHWFHGTVYDFVPNGNRSGEGGQFKTRDEMGKGEGPSSPGHWNNDIGTHFSTLPEVAESFAKGGGRHVVASRVAHADLHMANPIHYHREKDMDKHALDLAEQHLGGISSFHRPGYALPITRGHQSDSDFVRNHPHRDEIVKNFKTQLQAQGHDGITYGNDVEKPIGHLCAIAFKETPVTIHKWDWKHKGRQQFNQKQAEWDGHGNWLLYHGTSKENAEKIEQHGFQHGHETNGQSAGAGFYFHEHPHQAAQYGTHIVAVDASDAEGNGFNKIHHNPWADEDYSRFARHPESMSSVLKGDGYNGHRDPDDRAVVLYHPHQIHYLTHWDKKQASNDRFVKCDQGHRHWGAKGAAGLLFRHTDPEGTSRYLLQRRSGEVDHPHTYSVPGGAIGRAESPEKAAVRETREEFGRVPSHKISHTFSDDHGGWAYHTVVADVAKPFHPKGDNDEHGGAGWFTKDEIGGLPLHPGFASSWSSLSKTAFFTPHDRIFTHTFGLDHRLFDVDKLKSEISQDMILKFTGFCMRHNYRGWSKWARIFFFGSEASEWTSESLEGNGDFDTNVGIDFPVFKALNPQYASLADDTIAKMFTDQMKSELNNPKKKFKGVEGVYDQTWFANPGSWDITKIKPYAAYNVVTNEWAVKPPHLPSWSLSGLPSPVQRVLRAADSYARKVLSLPEPERTQQGAALFDAWHSDRTRAFSENGEGWWDIANLREKWLDQAGLWTKLVDCKHKYDEGLGSAGEWSNLPKTGANIDQRGFRNGNTLAASSEEEIGRLNADKWLPNIREHAAPNGKLYRMVHENPTYKSGKVTAHEPVGGGRYRGIGYLSYTSRPDLDDDSISEIHKVHVHPDHQRQGLASAMLNFARESRPGLRHSPALTEDGRAWSERVGGIADVPFNRQEMVRHEEGKQLLFKMNDDTSQNPGVCGRHLMENAKYHERLKGLLNGDTDLERPVHPGGSAIRSGEGRCSNCAQEQSNARSMLHSIDKGRLSTEPEHRTMTDQSRGYPYQKEHEFTPLRQSLSSMDRLYGSGKLSSMFPEDEDGPALRAQTPWPRVVKPDYDEKLVGRSITHPHEFEMRDFDPRNLHATQPNLLRSGVKHYFEGGHNYGRENGGDNRLGNETPRIYNKAGKNIILTGHHRAAASLLRGEPLRGLYILHPE